MHEMALCEGVLKILEDEAERQSFVRVVRVSLDIGALSHVEPEAMRFCFQAVTRGTLADGAELDIVRSKGMAWCLGCSEPVTIGRRGDPCPRCGGYQLQVTAGDEMRICELEVA